MMDYDCQKTWVCPHISMTHKIYSPSGLNTNSLVSHVLGYISSRKMPSYQHLPTKLATRRHCKSQVVEGLCTGSNPAHNPAHNPVHVIEY